MTVNKNLLMHHLQALKLPILQNVSLTDFHLSLTPIGSIFSCIEINLLNDTKKHA